VLAERISWAPGILLACSKLAPTLATELLCCDYVIFRNKYQILALSKLTVLLLYLVQHGNFCLNRHIILGNVEE